MINVAADPSKSLLTVRYFASVSPAEVERGLDDMRAALGQLTSGFRLLADLTSLESMDVACAPVIERAMDLCNERGASLVVRVIPDPQRDIGMNIMSVFHYGKAVRIITCQTLSEAEKLLAGETT